MSDSNSQNDKQVENRDQYDAASDASTTAAEQSGTDYRQWGKGFYDDTKSRLDSATSRLSSAVSDANMSDWVKAGGCVALGATVSVYAAPAVLGVSGFSSIGPAASSMAAAWQSTGVAMPIFSTLQSAAMGGYGTAAVTYGAAATGGGVGYLARRGTARRTDGDSGGDENGGGTGAGNEEQEEQDEANDEGENEAAADEKPSEQDEPNDEEGAGAGHTKTKRKAENDAQLLALLGFAKLGTSNKL